MTAPVYDLPERAQEVFDEACEAVISWDVAFEEICRIVAADELRGLVAKAASFGGDRARHYLSADVLIARADYLDPEGATR